VDYVPCFKTANVKERLSRVKRKEERTKKTLLAGLYEQKQRNLRFHIVKQQWLLDWKKINEDGFRDK
jgi:hypothetical protein